MYSQELHLITERTPAKYLAATVCAPSPPPKKIRFTPPLDVQVAALQGIKVAQAAKLIKDECLTVKASATVNMQVCYKIACSLSQGQAISMSKVRKINKLYSKCDANLQLLLGGKAGKKWAKHVIASMHDGDKYFKQPYELESEFHNPKSRETLIHISPTNYLKMVDAKDFSNQKLAGVRDLVKQGIKFKSIPYLGFVHNGKGVAQVQAQEGRHRAMVLKELGVKSMPCSFNSMGGGGGRQIRWGNCQDPNSFDYVPVMPTVLRSGVSKAIKIPFPQSDIFPQKLNTNPHVIAGKYTHEIILDNVVQIKSIKQINKLLAGSTPPELRLMLFKDYLDAWSGSLFTHDDYTKNIGKGGIPLYLEKDKEDHSDAYVILYNGVTTKLSDISNNKVINKIFINQEIKYINFLTDKVYGIKAFTISGRDEKFEEDKHPRLKDGEFAPKNGGKSSTPTKTKSVRDNHENTIIKDGKRVRENGEPLPDWAIKLKIPPKWEAVTIAKDPNASLLVTGKDSKGRPTSIYSLKHSQKAAAVKFVRIKDLDRNFKSIYKENEQARQSNNPRKKDAADCTFLIMKMGLRPGSDADTQAKEKAYGASNMLGKHVVVDGDKVNLKFTGKKGVKIDLPVINKDIKAMLIERKHKAGDDGKLFGHINEEHLLNHVHALGGSKGGYKTKDFRTLLATREATKLVANDKNPPKNEKEYKRKVMEVAKHCSSLLGNTPTICLQSYVNPASFAPWKIDNEK